MSWLNESRCANEGKQAGLSLNDFFESNRNAKKVQEVKKFCDSCSVRNECFLFAVKLEMPGIFGGTTEQEREQVVSLMGGPGKTVAYFSRFSQSNRI